MEDAGKWGKRCIYRERGIQRVAREREAERGVSRCFGTKKTASENRRNRPRKSDAD